MEMFSITEAQSLSQEYADKLNPPFGDEEIDKANKIIKQAIIDACERGKRECKVHYHQNGGKRFIDVIKHVRQLYVDAGYISNGLSTKQERTPNGVCSITFELSWKPAE